MNLTTRGFLRNEAEGKVLGFGFTTLNRCGVRAISWSNRHRTVAAVPGIRRIRASKPQNCC
jgi:hypothetical protein